MAAKKIGATKAATRKTRPAKAKTPAPKTAKVAQTKPAAKKAKAAAAKPGLKKGETKKVQAKKSPLKKAHVKKIAVKKAAAKTSPRKQAVKKTAQKHAAPPPIPAAKPPAATPTRKAPAKPGGRVPIRPLALPVRVVPEREAAAKTPPVSTRVEKAANPIKPRIVKAGGVAHLPLARVPTPSRSPARSPARQSLAAKAAAKKARSASVSDPICSEAALRDRIDKALAYLEAWVRAAGQMPLDNREAVAAEAARAQIWQWLTLEATCGEGEPLTPDRFKSLVDEEKSRLEDMSAPQTRFDAARTLLLDLSSAPTYPDFPSPLALTFIES